MSLAWMQIKPIGLGRPGYESNIDKSLVWMQI